MSSALRFLVIGLCLLTAAGIALIAMTLMKPAPVQQVAQEPPAPIQVSYLVAAHPLPAGTLVREEDFKAKLISPISMPAEALTDSPETRAGLRGALIRKFIDAGSPLASADVLRPRDRGFIASVLEAGNVAATIGVDPVTGVGGLIWPGDHVNVILTQTSEHASPATKALSETVLTNVRVIAIDQDMVQGASGDNTTAGKLARTVTLQVTPVQAQKLTVAGQMGKLSLVICSASDQVAIDTKPTYGVDVSQAALSNPPRGAIVRIFEGKDTREVSFP